MKLGLRVFLGFFLIVGLSAWLLLKLVLDEVKPVVRQVSEDNLVELSQLLAAMVTPQFTRDRSVPADLVKALTQQQQHAINIPIWQHFKSQLHLRVYITDEQGIVRFDSAGIDVGKNYARWNDVYLTLRGQYGARTTRDDPNDDVSSTMYVAAPIKHGDKIVGSLTVVLPNRNHQPYLLAAQDKLKRYGAIVLTTSLLIGLLSTIWLIRSLRKISHYAQRIHHEPGLKAPQFARGTELEQLMQSLQAMRETLDGKNYIEEYVHALTHELKSPLAATKAAQEILQDHSLSDDDRQRFTLSIAKQIDRMQLLIDKLLLLAKVEQRRELEQIESVNLNELMRTLLDDAAARVASKKLSVTIEQDPAVIANGDTFLLRLALNNILENAINHADANSQLLITLRADDQGILLTIDNQGQCIPDYALPRLGERFYALTRSDGQRGSGLGLRMVDEVTRLHGGAFSIANLASGVRASLRLPLNR